uniref:Uncharacterized protein LOC100186817 n=1 Tax=Phallusia mammillata TaxID=59560 RepID=A0A6F9DJ29_9ASCI|nr:uncharacterized protein LOC100186817 [Phallusia mammillata]
MRLYLVIALASITLIIVESFPNTTTEKPKVRCDVECKSRDIRFSRVCRKQCKVKTLDHCKTMYRLHPRAGFLCSRRFSRQCAGCGSDGFRPQVFANQCRICQTMFTDRGKVHNQNLTIEQINITYCDGLTLKTPYSGC